VFEQLQSGNRKRRNVAVVASLGAHCAFLGVLMWQHRPIFVSPSNVMLGAGGTSVSLVTLPATTSKGNHTPTSKALRAPVRKSKPSRVLEDPAPAALTAHAKADTQQSARAGTPYGSLLTGAGSGPEIRPALPTVFHDVRIPESELPPGVRGDVVVEITIDALGNITDKKVVKPLGYGLEERVLSALENWRFRPATKDGVAIASQQYVYFHFPS
jgi:TonB family protein